jgi:hypothetical protein
VPRGPPRATEDLLAAIVETSTDRLLFREHNLLFGPPVD